MRLKKIEAKRDIKKFFKYQAELRNDKYKFYKECVLFVNSLKEFLDRNTFINLKNILHKLTNQKKSKVAEKIFVIHGHNSEMKKDVQLFLANCGLEEIVLQEQPSMNSSVMQKFNYYANQCSFAIALFSEDDIQKDGKKRARQNVVFELGYFCGILGNDRVRILKQGNVEIPSDLSGIIYHEYNESGNWKINLAKEISAANINIDINKIVKKFS